jgi:hypothetical protein
LVRNARGKVRKTNQLLSYEARTQVQRRFFEGAEDGRCTALLSWVSVNCLCFWLGLKTWGISLTEKQRNSKTTQPEAAGIDKT